MECVCKTCKFYSCAVGTLNEYQKNLLSSNCTSVLYNKGDNIFVQNNFSPFIGYLKSGLAKLHMTGLNGKEQIIKIAKAPTYLSITTAIGNKTNQYSATALLSSRVCFIDLEVFKKLIYSNPGFSYEIILDMSKNELRHFKTCFDKTHKNTKGLVADTLLIFSTHIFNSRNFSIPLSRSEIANYVNSSRESVCRVLSEFHNENIIELNGKEISILNMDLLKKISVNG